MATELKLRGGTTAEHATFTGAAREATVDTDKNTIVVHDGSTAGGFPLAREEAGQGVFAKADPYSVAWERPTGDTVRTAQQLFIEVDGRVFTIPAQTTVTVPSFSAGTDYAIWAKPDGSLEATSSFVNPPVAGSRWVGGFHYAPGGNAPLDPAGNWANHDGGNTTPQINEYSFYDLKWRPAVADPRGLTLVNNAFWAGIYHLVRDHLSGPAHRYNAAIAKDGQNPQNPYGDGSQYYSDSNWWNISEALAYHGFSNFTPQDFQIAAIGVKEQASRGNDPVTTGIATTNAGSSNGDEKFTSHWGCFQMTGVVQIWAADLAVSSSNQTTSGLQGRGGRNRYSTAANLGRFWDSGSESGSRAANSSTPWRSTASLGGRGRCDHLILV